MLEGFDPQLLLVLNLAGTFAFGVSGALAGVRAKLDLFGVLVLAAVVGLAGGVILGVLSGIGGVLRDLLLGKVPVVLRRGLYAVPARVGAAIVVAACRIGWRGIAFPILAASACFFLRMLGLRYDIDLPGADTIRGFGRRGGR